MTDEKLKPCPWCGDGTIAIDVDEICCPVEYTGQARCTECDACGPCTARHDTKDDAIEEAAVLWDAISPPRIKPLEWEREDNFLRAYNPELRIGYEIQRRKDGTLYARGPHNDWMPAETRDEIKLAASMQADYERRILSALDL
jgi:hypothetical protein